MKVVLDACDDFETWSWATRSSSPHQRHPGFIRPPPSVPAGTACPAPTCGRRAWTGTAARRQAVPRVPRPRLPGLDPPRRRLYSRYWVRLQETGSRLGWCLPVPRGHPDRRSWRGAGASSRSPKVRPGSRPRTRSARWLLRDLEGGHRPVPVKIRSASFSNVSIRAWRAARRVRPRRDHDPRVACTSSSATSTDDRDPDPGAQHRLGRHAGIKTLIILAIIPLGALISGYVFLLKMMSHMQSRSVPWTRAAFHGCTSSSATA